MSSSILPTPYSAECVACTVKQRLTLVDTREARLCVVGPGGTFSAYSAHSSRDELARKLQRLPVRARQPLRPKGLRAEP